MFLEYLQPDVNQTGALNWTWEFISSTVQLKSEDHKRVQFPHPHPMAFQSLQVHVTRDLRVLKAGLETLHSCHIPPIIGHYLSLRRDIVIQSLFSQGVENTLADPFQTESRQDAKLPDPWELASTMRLCQGVNLRESIPLNGLIPLVLHGRQTRCLS